MQQVYTPPPRTQPFRRTALDMAALFVLLTLLAGVTAAATWGFWHTGRIYTGVSVAGVSLGGLTRSEAYQRLGERLRPYPLPPIVLEHEGEQRPLSVAQVQARADLLDAVNRAYLYGRSGSLLNDVVAQLRAALLGVVIVPRVEVDAEELRAAVAALAAGVDRPAVAERRLGDVVIPAQAGRSVDVEATLQGLLQQLADGAAGTVRAPLVVHSIAAPAPSVTPSAPLNSDIEMRPLLLRSQADNFALALTPAELRNMLRSVDPPELDEASLRRFLEPIAAQIERRPRDARLRFNPQTGAVTVLSPSFPGRALDVEATIAAIRSAIVSGADEASLVVKTIEPAVDMNRIAEMGIRELVASGRTYFAGSSASRIRNIEVAAKQFEGVVIPPNGIFSFNQIVRDVSSANGFEDSLIIWGDRTAVGVGGGVCQVSTTVFRAAYQGGFPIVERYNHGYVVDWYGEPGLDATIFTPTVDFRFRNDTGAYLLIEPVVDSVNGVITFNFYGTKPNRTVTISKPEITDVIKPGPPVYTVDESLAPGQMKQVEWQKDGMTVTVTRTIVENGTTRTDTLRSKYQPWRAVYLVGPGTVTPTPEPTSTP
ncbi:VanW family protein [Caldilinea sp.]|uniref:VanW family protein n=1 Tax=Caldilinea sp. TaxID=2293560 RepID=UPI0021DBE71E|nr:VanW family protein [Caldilinea sp.]GIV67542.1 MAG: VanW family protein [Caldilinea sp.]